MKNRKIQKNIKVEQELADKPESNLVERWSFFFILAGSGILFSYLLWPLLFPILFACIFASACYPLMISLQSRTGWNRPVSAFIIICFLFLIIFLPSIYLVVRLSQEVVKIYLFANEFFTAQYLNEVLFGENMLSNILHIIFDFFNIPYTIEKFNEILFGFISKITGSSFAFLNSFLNNSFEFLIQFAVMLTALFGILWEGEKLKVFLFKLIPMKLADEEDILQQFNKMNYLTLVHNGIAALIQGSLAGLGLLVCGIESVILWTVLMILFALLPYVGTGIVFIPAAGYMYYSGRPLMAIFLIVWCVSVSLIVENFYKPLFMARGISIDGFLVFFSVIGGIASFGVSGLFLGPLVLVFFLTISKLYFKNYTTE